MWYSVSWRAGFGARADKSMPASNQPARRSPAIRRDVGPSGHVLDLRVDRVDYDECVARVVEAARPRRFSAVAAANVHLVMEARRDAELARLLAAFELVVPMKRL